MCNSLRHKKVAVIGLGVSNQAAIRFLVRQEAHVEVFDQKDEENVDPALLRQLYFWNVPYVGGPTYLDILRQNEYDYLCLTPGMRKDLPPIVEALASGAQLMSEIGLFFEHCPCPIIGITGSAGKTTTTTLLAAMLERAFDKKRIWTGGNIGVSLLEWVEDMRPDDLAVVELSSFQLQMLSRSPDTAVVLNVRPNHLDIHASMDEYVEAKKNITRFQTSDQFVVLSADDPITRGMATTTKARCFYFSNEQYIPDGACVQDGHILIDGEPLLAASDVHVPGRHNLANIMAAALVAHRLGASHRAIVTTVTQFRGVEHRLERIVDAQGVAYVNDSIATSPDRTIAALDSFSEPVILLAGGYDKQLDYDELGRHIAEKVKLLLLFGATAEKIEAAVRKYNRGKRCTVVRVDDLSSAVETAYRMSRPGDVVLLSPASASYDQFANYRERGNAFVRKVLELTGQR